MITTFTSAGKSGDCILQWPVAFWWHRETQEPFDVWLDEKSCAMLLPLIQAQPGVQEAKLIGGIEHWGCGGQPWHFSLDPEVHKDRRIIHMGFRLTPTRQITFQTLKDVPIQLEVDPDTLAETPSLVVPEEPKANRLVLHGAGFYRHSRQTPSFWRFISDIRQELEAEFQEIVFIGSPDEREIGTRVYPDWKQFDDGGDFLKLGSYLNASRLMIGMGSSPVALAGALKVPAIRVHDDIGGMPKVIWSNLGKNQVNATEIELRELWPEFRDQFVKGQVVL